MFITLNLSNVGKNEIKYFLSKVYLASLKHICEHYHKETKLSLLRM